MRMGNMVKYEHRYRYGKQTGLIGFQEFKDSVKKARLNSEKIAYVWMLYFTGARKSEVYELTVKDCQLTETHFIVDIFRKKHGAQVDPLRLPRTWAEVELIVEQFKKAVERNPSRKRVFFQENKTTKSRVVKDQWLFPHIQSATAWRTVKDVLGKEFYPHYLRLNRITELCSDPTANISRIKSYTGIKTIEVIQDYLGTSRKEQEKALSWMERNRGK
jgi:integrase